MQIRIMSDETAVVAYLIVQRVKSKVTYRLPVDLNWQIIIIKLKCINKIQLSNIL